MAAKKAAGELMQMVNEVVLHLAEAHLMRTVKFPAEQPEFLRNADTGLFSLGFHREPEENCDIVCKEN